MSLVKVSGNASGTGTLTIAAPNTNSDYTLTLPTNSGTIISTASTAAVTQTMLSTNIAGTGPAFSAYLSTNQTISAATVTKIQIDTENFDTASCFNNTGSTVGGIPAYSFLPNVAGYYQVNLVVGGTAGTSMTYAGGLIVKNGTAYTRVLVPGFSTASADSSNSVVIYMNGTTDYLEFSAQINGTGTLQVASTQLRTTASAALIRSA
jgi:hypothetical protein